jgi:hypothetical protein
VGKRDTFFRIISPEHLYFAAGIFGIVTLAIVVIIYFFLYSRKRQFRFKEKMLETLN